MGLFIVGDRVLSTYLPREQGTVIAVYKTMVRVQWDSRPGVWSLFPLDLIELVDPAIE